MYSEISPKSWLLAVKSPVQSLDYRVNSYHIHLNNLEFHGYTKEISQKYPCSFQHINTSFPNTHSPPCHSPFPSSSSRRQPQRKAQESPAAKSFFSQNLQASNSSFFPEGNGCQLHCAWGKSIPISSFLYCSSLYSCRFIYIVFFLPIFLPFWSKTLGFEWQDCYSHWASPPRVPGSNG